MSRSARPLTLALGLGALLLPAIANAQALVVCSEASPDFLNPQFSSQNTAYDVAAQIYERLTATERGGSQIIPSLAESWTISDDALTYTFKLRKGVKWHASKSFTPTREFNADDVLFSFNRMLDANHPYAKVGSGNYQFFGEIVKPSLKAVEKVDDYTVRIVLTKPNAPLLSALSVEPMSVLSAEYAAAMSKAGTPEQIDFAPIGTGPFSLLSYQKDAVIRFKAVPDHWTKAAGDRDRMALVNDLIFVITPDAAVRFAKVRSGECQIARYPNPGDLAAMKTEPTINVLQGSIADQSFLAFNQQKKPFGDKRVREALAYAVNIPAIIDAVYQGTGKPTASAVPPSLWSHDADLKPRPYDPEKAKALLKEAGYPDGFETTLWAIPVVRAYMPNGRRAAELIQADWARIGVKATIQTFEWGEYLKRGRAGEHEVGMFGYTWDYPDPSQILLTGWTCEGVATGANRARWCNKEASDALAKASTITDQAERSKLYKRFQEIFHEDVAGLLFANAQAFTPVRKEVKDYKIHFFGGQPFVGVSIGK
ncbi:dipeptide transporter; periplasmic-binding component of ABC superfamily [Bosea sp. 62]|uniref:ABC transporter substrate-binding protein n=1 Tax=unclassified Bosea (in: a-proteobacteria) TaxID=2653178 RepID=UPI00125C2109|nr:MULTISPECIES: ABC transporter substrate-binding protein [unclassified Bosea (in: a-proteobacteria)]CAD5255093.1 dipeptide transporter; periplasmic-binding component of ABC superfamily [Bosea sp. 7B]CAD5275797.1 dipeptide transporter; periplasmic-binding component of ABC superfamily [Bosea sp. 21B]CAD5276853.1 dipeptide transporter; periplasmic-binding component of ABC superfamily [Bosea sp. 46]VVT59956.1 dipeptide transporter; periplasmic-binding component of ABC superfamily [Bosea sp. EC-HK